jgi:AAA+ ATPase superfamily predicted ATPase
MRHVPRKLKRQVLKAVKAFPAVVLTGTRQSGKTWLLRHFFPKSNNFLLEDPDIVAPRVRALSWRVFLRDRCEGKIVGRATIQRALTSKAVQNQSCNDLKTL